MEQQPKMIFEEHIMAMQDHEEDIITIRGKAFLVRPATETDIQRIAKGYFCMD